MIRLKLLKMTEVEKILHIVHHSIVERAGKVNWEKKEKTASTKARRLEILEQARELHKPDLNAKRSDYSLLASMK